jgi:ribosomal protein S18 acetylase RimI-like enzyme
MAAPDPIRLRPLDADSADLNVAFELIRSCELDVVGRTDATLESVTSSLAGPLGWRAVQRLAYIGEQPRGVLAAELMRDSREVFLDAFAVGDRTGEILALLLADGMSAATEEARQDVDWSVDGIKDLYTMSADFWQVTAAAFTQDSTYVAVLESSGFKAIRRFWRMVCDVDRNSDVDPVAPKRVTLRVVEGEADERQLHRLFTDSFSEHFGHTVEEPFESWIPRVRANAGNREDGWWIADLDGKPVGLCIVDDSKAEFGEGYVRTLGVLSHARGRGIGRWLLQCAAVDAARHGRAVIALTVDGANTTGATALYESVGYRIRQEVDVYCQPLTALLTPG